MLRSNTSAGGKILLILITFILTIALLAGAVLVVYKTASVRRLAELFGADSLISESYEGTVEDLVQLVTDIVSDGDFTLNELIEISPYVGDTLNAAADNVEDSGLVGIDRAALFSTPVNQISASLGSLAYVTASLRTLSQTFSFALPDMPVITGNAEQPLYFYTQANATETGDLAGIFTFGKEEYSFRTRSSAYSKTYGAENEPVAVWEERKLYGAAGVSEGENGVLCAGDYTLYLRTERADAAEPSYTALTAKNTAVYDFADGTVRLALSEGQDLHESLCVRTGETVYTPFKDVFPENWETDGTVYEPQVAAAYRYSPLYYEDGQGGFRSANVFDEQNGAYEADETRGGYTLDLPYEAENAAGYYTQTTELYYEEYLYSEAMTEAEAEALIRQAQSAGEAPPALYVRTDGIADLPVTGAIDTLSSVLDPASITLDMLSAYFGVEFGTQEGEETTASAELLDLVRYIPLGSLNTTMQAEMQNIPFSNVVSVSADSPRMLLFLAFGEEGADYKIENGTLTVYHNKTAAELFASLDSLRIGDLILIGAGSDSLLQTVQDWTLHDFAKSAKIGSLTLGDVLNVGENSPAILQALADVSIDGMEDAMNSLTLGEILGDSVRESELLSLLSGSTLPTLADDIASLSVQTMFADSVYAYYDTGHTAADIAELSAIYGAGNLYVHGDAAYEPYDGSKHDTSETLYSPYLLLSSQEGYKGVPLYTLQNGKMTLATKVTGWKPTQAQLETYGTAKLYYDRGGEMPVDSFGRDTVFTVDTLYAGDPAAETMTALALSPAVYGIAEGEQTGTNYFTRLHRANDAQIYNDNAYYTESNLYYFDIAAQSWRSVPLKGVFLDGNHNETAVTEETDKSGLTLYYRLPTGAQAPQGALYTYGEVLGIWKYLLKDENGAEQTYTLEDVGEMVANINANINAAPLRKLVEDGIVIIHVTPDPGQTEAEAVEEILKTPIPASLAGETGHTELGQYTTGELITLLARIIGTYGSVWG